MLIDQIANELLIAGHLLKTNNVSRIAEELGYRPMLIINALYHGADAGKFKYHKKRDTITATDDVELEALTPSDSSVELRDQIEMFINYLSRDEKDMSVEQLQMLLGGTPELHIKMAIYTSNQLTSYELKDPKDKKSVYTFITLAENVDKQWGKKQFKGNESEQ